MHWKSENCALHCARNRIRMNPSQGETRVSGRRIRISANRQIDTTREYRPGNGRVPNLITRQYLPDGNNRTEGTKISGRTESARWRKIPW